MRTDDQTFLDQLRTLAKLDNPEAVREELETVRLEDLAEAFTRLEHEESLAILNKLEEETAAEILVELPTETARKLINQLPDDMLAHYLDILPMDDALELQEELSPERFEALLEVIPAEDRLEIRRLMTYPEDSAGRIMTEDFLAVRPEDTVGEAIRLIREAPEEEYEAVNDVYVLTGDGHLVGVFSLRDAIRAEPDLLARDVMKSDLVTCSPLTLAEDVARQIARYGFYAMPVVDGRGRMLGFVTVDDAQEILSEADTEDVLALGGVSGDAEAYLSLSVAQLVRRRLPWLFVLFVAETLTGAVLRHYLGPSAVADGGHLAIMAQLTLFIPLLIGAGGNSGSQVTTTITRALAVGEVKTSDFLIVFRREFVTALFVGAALGIVGFARAYFGWSSGWHVSLIVGIALPSIVVWAATIGSALPLGAKRLGIDPAVMSAPFITTFVDATGLIIYFEIARRVLGLEF